MFDQNLELQKQEKITYKIINKKIDLFLTECPELTTLLQKTKGDYMKRDILSPALEDIKNLVVDIKNALSNLIEPYTQDINSLSSKIVELKDFQTTIKNFLFIENSEDLFKEERQLFNVLYEEGEYDLLIQEILRKYDIVKVMLKHLNVSKDSRKIIENRCLMYANIRELVHGANNATLTMSPNSIIRIIGKEIKQQKQKEEDSFFYKKIELFKEQALKLKDEIKRAEIANSKEIIFKYKK